MRIQHIKFKPIIKDKIWGGQRLRTLLGKDFGSLPNGGESWEISGIDGDLSVVAEGEFAGMSIVGLIEKLGANLVGKHSIELYGKQFPLLVKFIDANEKLSIQVHPDDELARARHDCFGKTEMWYVIEAEDDAQLISGFARKVEPEQYYGLVESGQFADVLASHTVHHGDVFFMPAGRIHAIGQGVMVAEIQQTSGLTYRIYDYDRVDAKGNKRELHIDEAKDAIDFDDMDSGKRSYLAKTNDSSQIVTCQYFTVNFVKVDGEVSRDYSRLDSFVIYVCVGGSVSVDGTAISYGETLLVAASTDYVRIEGAGELLEVYI